MRNRKDRRRNPHNPYDEYQNNGRDRITKERRKGRERRMDRLELEERQLLLSEMPWPIPDPRP